MRIGWAAQRQSWSCDQNTAKYRVLRKVNGFRWNNSIPRTRAVHRDRTAINVWTTIVFFFFFRIQIMECFRRCVYHTDPMSHLIWISFASVNHWNFPFMLQSFRGGSGDHLNSTDTSIHPHISTMNMKPIPCAAQNAQDWSRFSFASPYNRTIERLHLKWTHQMQNNTRAKRKRWETATFDKFDCVHVSTLVLKVLICQIRKLVNMTQDTTRESFAVLYWQTHE